MFGRAGSEPKLLFPGLAGFYAAVSDLWYPMIRVTAGGCLLYHGWGKLMSGATPIAAAMARNGFIPAPRASPISSCSWRRSAPSRLSSVCLRVFSRPAIAIEMAVIAFHVQMPQGFPAAWSCS